MYTYKSETIPTNPWHERTLHLWSIIYSKLNLNFKLYKLVCYDPYNGL